MGAKQTLPDLVLIGGIPFPIRMVRDLRDPENLPLYGTISFVNGEIQIEEGISDSAKWTSLWHEIVHGLAEQASIELAEDVVEILGYGLAGVINKHANPRLVERLL
jgi:hypothetical protein